FSFYFFLLLRTPHSSTLFPYTTLFRSITYRLKDIEKRLDPARFIRLGRGTLANVDLITKVNTMPGGTHVAVLSTGQKLPVSRLRSEEHTSELQSRENLVCRLLLEKKK